MACNLLRSPKSAIPLENMSHLISNIFWASLLPLSVAGCNQQADPPAPHPKESAIRFATEYQAVFMQNGQVFFGKLDNVESTFPILRDVYYIRNQINPETKAPDGVLIKRSSELHGPDVMYINARQIALIEPVGSASRIGQLLVQAKGTLPGK